MELKAIKIVWLLQQKTGKENTSVIILQSYFQPWEGKDIQQFVQSFLASPAPAWFWIMTPSLI